MHTSFFARFGAVRPGEAVVYCARFRSNMKSRPPEPDQPRTSTALRGGPHTGNRRTSWRPVPPFRTSHGEANSNLHDQPTGRPSTKRARTTNGIAEPAAAQRPLLTLRNSAPIGRRHGHHPSRSTRSLGQGVNKTRGSPLRRTLGLTVTVALSVAALPIYAVATAPAFGGASAAGTLVAAYGIGNLLGSAGRMLRPLRRDADPLMCSLSALVAATLILVMLTPTLPTALIAFGLAGIANAMFFAATLAARSEYAPIDARGQVFIWVGAL